MSRDIQTNWGKPSEARITAPAAAADVDVIASVGMNLTPECWDPDLLAILGSGSFGYFGIHMVGSGSFGH